MKPAGVTFRLLMPDEYPSEGQCVGCGRAKPFLLNADGTYSPMRWFYVTGANLEKQHWGKYCERCVQIAAQAGKEIRKINEHIKR